MKNIFKKNQIIITALALMIAVAGYLQYTGTQSDDKVAKEASADLSDTTYEISDEEFSADDIFTEEEEATAQTEAQADAQTEEAPLGIQTGEDIAAQNEQEAAENPGEAVLTSNSIENVNFAAEVKLNREQVRSQNKETLLEIINNTNISEEQKQAAIDAMVAMTDIAERENAAEMLLEAKGFTDVVVSITDDNADVVLNMGQVTDAKRAQIEDIVKRKTNITPENIIITPIQGSATETTTEE
ncbi:SpoIIIAH-like family protein [Roseburia sp. 499]|uniref:SpoIIIAH-like family protein n=1 Tax=Roseburia sp. 499 TaxID=1261634 RepID=UPI00095200DA|nr:SpoIIIAH-like family protein [Roseburia sp. 499]WVK71104.1 SpoIIIAH-like family protein [Roseburia sp. 499]